MEPHHPPIVIAGAGMAGCYAANTLRKEGFDGRIAIIGAESHLPYDRPPLSKELLRGEKSADKVFLHPATHYEELGVTVDLSTTLTALHPREHQIEDAGGRRIPYAKLLIATGGEVRIMNVPGSDLAGIYYLRTLDDSLRISEELKRSPRVVVVGAGFIGSEIAASARLMGCEVTILELEDVPLLRVLGPEVGTLYAEIHRDHGVQLRLNDGLAGFRGTDRVDAVLTTSGDVLPCDVAVVGVGIRPAVSWLRSSGIALDNGVVVDEYCASSAPDVFAAGDLANWYHPRLGHRLRVEHWDNAMHQGVAAAKSMLGKREPYAPVPYFWSDQFEINLQYVGHAMNWDQVVFRGDIPGRSLSAFYVRDGKVVAALVINRFKDLRPSRRLIESMSSVDPEQLADPQIDLRTLSR